jgi:hypothetical protein
MAQLSRELNISLLFYIPVVVAFSFALLVLIFLASFNSKNDVFIIKNS